MGCRTADFLISRGLRAVGAPPFIGLLPLDDAVRDRAIERTRLFLGGRTDRLSALFIDYPNLAAWLVTHALNAGYGEDRAVYQHISDILCVPLNSDPQRKRLYSSFCGVLDRLGLSNRGFDRQVDVYLLHAGVSQAQLPHVIDAFLRQEAAFGPPPVESSELLNRWENDALSFLPPSVLVPRRPILWDESAWHAALFARASAEGFVPAFEFEKRFQEVLKERRATVKRGAQGHTVPRPRLAWQAGELLLRLPRCEGHIRLWLDGTQRPLRLRGGEDWPLPQPWPREIRWEIEGQDGQLELLTDCAFALFDRTTGHLLREIELDPAEIEVDASDTVILARQRFSVEGESALEPEADSFVGFARLGAQAIRLGLGGGEIVLRAKPRRRLYLAGAELAQGPRGPLYGPSACLRIETGMGRPEERTLHVTAGGETKQVNVAIGGDGCGELALADLLANFPEAADPLRLRVELLAPGSERGVVHGSVIVLTAWIWPSFRGAEGNLLRSDQPPRNLVEAQCFHVDRDDRGYLCLDPGGGYALARAVFDIEGANVPFDLPWSDVTVTRRRASGSVSQIPLGARLTFGEDDRFDTISIRCPDTTADLIVRGRSEERPFGGGLARNLAARDLLHPSLDDRVILRRGNGSEVFLFEIVPALTPGRFAILPARRAVRLRLTFPDPVDAIAVEIEDEIEDEAGRTKLAEAALRYRQVETRGPDWLHAEICDNDANNVQLTIGIDWLDGGARLARLLVRPDGRDRWQPLRKARGDSFAVALVNPEAEPTVAGDDLVRRFETVNRWLTDCYAIECWPTIERALLPRWRDYGRALIAMPGGAGVLMRAAALPPPDHAAPGWIPILHPVQFLPDLYTAPPQAFAALAASGDPGVAEMAALAALNTARLREQSHLDPTVYLAFRNRREADETGARLEGFSPAQFYGNLPMLPSDPSAGWFWRGTPLLGPDHWRSAHLKLVDRLETAGLFIDDTAEEGPNSRRQASLHRLMQAAWEATAEKLRPSAPRRTSDAAQATLVDLWASALLSGFARASRFGEVTRYVTDLADRTGTANEDVLTSIAFILRLAPELFAFHLLLWQIAKDRP